MEQTGPTPSLYKTEQFSHVLERMSCYSGILALVVGVSRNRNVMGKCIYRNIFNYKTDRTPGLPILNLYGHDMLRIRNQELITLPLTAAKTTCLDMQIITIIDYGPMIQCNLANSIIGEADTKTKYQEAKRNTTISMQSGVTLLLSLLLYP